MIDLNPKYLKTVQAILALHVPEYEVRVFGSRAKWTAIEHSDLDLAVVGSEPFGIRKMRKLSEAFEDSNLPIRIDIVDWHSVSDGFKKVIAEKYEVIQEAKPAEASVHSSKTYGTQDARNAWQTQSFGECASLIREVVSPSDLDHTPYIGLEHIGEGTLALEGHGEASSVVSTKSRFKQGDILFGKLRCYFRKVVRAPFDGICSTDIWVTRAKEGVDQGFLFYCMASQSFVDFADTGSEGTRMPRTQWDWVSKYDISLPSLSEQHRIAQILEILDTKIELNRQMNETLEATARAIFKSWFVNFDPVRAKMEGREPIGMDAQTAALFPSAFQDSPLGEIPEGWEVGTLGEIAQNVRLSAKVNEINSEDVYIGLEHMPKRNIALSEWQAANGIGSNKSRFRKGEILFGKLRPYFHKVGVAPIDGICSTDILVIRPIKPKWFGVVLGIVSAEEFVSYTDSHSTGTRMPRTNWGDMSRYEFVRPQIEIAQKYSDLIQPLIGRMIENIHQSHTLANIRDVLLPKLLSGEIRVN